MKLKTQLYFIYLFPIFMGIMIQLAMYYYLDSKIQTIVSDTKEKLNSGKILEIKTFISA